MSTQHFEHFVFIDFENVSEVDLALIAGKPVHATLIVGKNQAKLDFELVEQIHRQASQIELLKLEVSGRNALDLVLAYKLGQALTRNEKSHYYIVSKDKDFDALITHLKAQGIKVGRIDEFSALPFLPKIKKPTPKSVPKASVASQAKKAPTQTSAGETAGRTSDERYANMVHRLTNNLNPRPKTKKALLGHIKTAFGGKLSEEETAEKLSTLLTQKVLFLNAKDQVSYAQVKRGGSSDTP